VRAVLSVRSRSDELSVELLAFVGHFDLSRGLAKEREAVPVEGQCRAERRPSPAEIIDSVSNAMVSQLARDGLVR
jgi:hypothetical protein